MTTVLLNHKMLNEIFIENGTEMSRDVVIGLTMVFDQTSLLSSLSFAVYFPYFSFDSCKTAVKTEMRSEIVTVTLTV